MGGLCVTLMFELGIYVSFCDSVISSIYFIVMKLMLLGLSWIYLCN